MKFSHDEHQSNRTKFTAAYSHGGDFKEYERRKKEMQKNLGKEQETPTWSNRRLEHISIVGAIIRIVVILAMLMIIIGSV